MVADAERKFVRNVSFEKRIKRRIAESRLIELSIKEHRIVVNPRNNGDPGTGAGIVSPLRLGKGAKQDRSR